MSVSDLSASSQDYLKVIWSLSEWSEEPVMASAVAERVGVRLSTVSDAVKRLAAQNLVESQPYGAITLTEQGREAALTMIRRHRLLETFLVQTLGYSWDEVHSEAEVLEHAVSDLLVERISSFLRHPDRDPHGDPIPAPSGAIEKLAATNLAQCEPGDRVRVERVSDEDAALLQFLTDQGIKPGTVLEVMTPPPFSQDITVRVGASGQRLPLGPGTASHVWVDPIR